MKRFQANCQLIIHNIQTLDQLIRIDGYMRTLIQRKYVALNNRGNECMYLYLD